ncbi:MAG TPA: response regulator transcription factor [Chitinophagaceae bacterium]|jgi:DNA-binding NarL/FixJ family response regulator|nr:response regulator transcription factor [Chitinophagaceae bacterium]
MTTIALADDHTVMRNGLATLLKGLGYTILYEADNGKDFISKINKEQPPDVALLDINMPGMDGYDTAAWLKENFPDVKVLALSMYDDEAAIIRMLKNGAKGYILKDSNISDVRAAIESVMSKGYYHSELVTGKLIHSINHLDAPAHSSIKELLKLNNKETEFLKLACTEMSYKEIAEKMFLSPRTVEGYRDTLFEKLGVKTRVGLVLFAIKNKIVNI